MNRARDMSNFTPARSNSWSSRGMSKRLELNPAMSQPSSCWASDAATCRNVGSDATSASVIWCMAVASAGMGTPGLMRRVFSSTRPSGISLTSEISTMRSRVMFVPVVSRSKNTSGRVSFSFISGAASEFAHCHRHEQHHKLRVVGLRTRTEHAGTAGVAKVYNHLVAFDSIENFHQIRGTETDSELSSAI